MSDPSVPLTIITHRFERALVEGIGEQIETNFLATPQSPTASPDSANPLVSDEVKTPRPVKIEADTQFIFYTAQPLTDKELSYLTRVFKPLVVYNSHIHGRYRNLRDISNWQAIVLNLGDPDTHNCVERVWKTIQEDSRYCTIAYNNSGVLSDMNPILQVLEAQMLLSRINTSRSREDFLHDLERTVLPIVNKGLWAGIRKLLVYEFLGTKIWTIGLNLLLWFLYSSTGKCHDTVVEEPASGAAPP